MASATGIPEQNPTTTAGEDEPLLGGPGDASQTTDRLQYNLVLGTAILAQAGIWILATLVWASVFMAPEFTFVCYHPLVNSAGILLLTQAILVLQPTHTAKQKETGTHVHFALNLVGVMALISGLIIMEMNKAHHPETRFTHVHGVMGLITYILIFLQALIGFSQFYVPNQVFGSVEKGKAIYKYHRMSGYVILVMALATICAATQTPFNANVLHIKLWAVIVAAFVCIRFKPCHYLQGPLRRWLSKSQRLEESPRPTTAPKQFPDIKHIRQNVQIHTENCINRNYKAQASSPAKIASLAKESNEVTRSLLTPRARLNDLSKQIAKAQAATQPESDGLDSALKEASELATVVKKAEERKAQCDDEAHKLALSMPNLTSPQTPREEQRILSYINYQPGQGREYSSSANHATIGRTLSLLDFSSASTTSGWGFYYLINEGALLEQALIQYALAVAMCRGWHAVSPPSVVYSHIADACGFQPRDQNDEQQIWQIEQLEKDKGKPRRSLAATAEIPLAGLYAGKDIPEPLLPVKLVGSSRCYRAEAGARGVDTRGLYRVHEFTKVEMFAWTNAPESSIVDLLSPEWTRHSSVVFDEMVAIQTEILTSLGLPSRVLEMPSTDLGASAYRKIDIEALFPSRMSREGGWGEVTSTSICTDYQSRRLDTRIKDKSGKRNRFPHTVNGTAMAIPRVLAAILEHGWREAEGVVDVPEVLRPFMAGLKVIGPK